VRIAALQLEVPRALTGATERFYASLDIAGRVGETAFTLAPANGAPFYHVALLVPGDRFDAALAWIRERVELLPGAAGEVFDFAFWNACACYFHDPAGSIVELVAHRGIAENGTEGPFTGDELAGVSEIGLVGDTPVLAAALAEVGIAVWDGSLEPGQLAFAGEQARTLILAPVGRGWLPTGRPAEPHPLEVVVAAGRDATVELGPHSVRVI